MPEPSRQTVPSRDDEVWGNLLLPSDSFDIDKHLWERVASESPSRGAVSWVDAQESMVFDVDYRYDYDATLTILGFAYTDHSVTPVRMRRVNPLRHPRKPWLHAASIESVQYFGPRGKEKSEEDDWKYVTQPSNRAEYKIARISVLFKPLSFDILEDKDVPLDALPARGPNEHARYVEKHSSSAAEFLTREGGDAWRFVTAPVANNPITSLPFSISESKLSLEWTWYYVPEDFVCRTRGNAPDKWREALNNVNLVKFAAAPKWTLLHLPFTYERRRMPVASYNGIQLYYLNIKSNWLYFEPGDISSADRGAGYNGHNTAPSPDDWKYHFFTGNLSPSTKEGGTVNGKMRYEQFDFDRLFHFVDV